MSTVIAQDDRPKPKWTRDDREFFEKSKRAKFWRKRSDGVVIMYDDTLNPLYEIVPFDQHESRVREQQARKGAACLN